MLDLTKFDAYLVGGFVRDRLLGRDPHDHDYVVCGATEQDMLDAGFALIPAQSFPVFHHPITRDEYALARTERKTGNGYHGFDVVSDPSITIEQDLKRRDLTINSLARKVLSWNDEGHAKLSDTIIDPFGGQQDLMNGILRHVSEAFSEDVVRVLRVARFQARYNFTIAKETKMLMKQLVDAGELDHLTPERIFNELDKAIMEDYPNLFFWALMDCGAADKILPGFGRSIIHVGSQLKRATLRMQPKMIKYMVLFSHMNDVDGNRLLTSITATNEIIRMTSAFRFVLKEMRNELTPSDVVRILDNVDAYKQPAKLFTIGDALAMFDHRWNDSFDLVLESFRITRNVTFADLSEGQQATLKGREIKKAINELKVVSIRHLFHKY